MPATVRGWRRLCSSPIPLVWSEKARIEERAGLGNSERVPTELGGGGGGGEVKGTHAKATGPGTFARRYTRVFVGRVMPLPGRYDGVATIEEPTALSPPLRLHRRSGNQGPFSPSPVFGGREGEREGEGGRGGQVTLNLTNDTPRKWDSGEIAESGSFPSEFPLMAL